MTLWETGTTQTDVNTKVGRGAGGRPVRVNNSLKHDFWLLTASGRITRNSRMDVLAFVVTQSVIDQSTTLYVVNCLLLL